MKALVLLILLVSSTLSPASIKNNCDSRYDFASEKSLRTDKAIIGICPKFRYEKKTIDRNSTWNFDEIYKTNEVNVAADYYGLGIEIGGTNNIVRTSGYSEDRKETTDYKNFRLTLGTMLLDYLSLGVDYKSSKSLSNGPQNALLSATILPHQDITISFFYGYGYFSDGLRFEGQYYSRNSQVTIGSQLHYSLDSIGVAALRYVVVRKEDSFDSSLMEIQTSLRYEGDLSIAVRLIYSESERDGDIKTSQIASFEAYRNLWEDIDITASMKIGHSKHQDSWENSSGVHYIESHSSQIVEISVGFTYFR